jgi:hypothetical protein
MYTTAQLLLTPTCANIYEVNTHNTQDYILARLYTHIQAQITHKALLQEFYNVNAFLYMILHFC